VALYGATRPAGSGHSSPPDDGISSPMHTPTPTPADSAYGSALTTENPSSPAEPPTGGDPGNDSTIVPSPPASPVIQDVRVEVGDYRKIGSGLYQLAGSKVLNVRYWWTTTTNYGVIESTDTSCTVVGTVTNLATRRIAATARSATCSLQGWQSADLPQGSYRLSVSVTLESGARGTGTLQFRIVP
jgi:hypothetical protein